MDNPEDTRWLSYDELAKLRGIDKDSAVRLVRRKRWPKREGNAGAVRIAVPGSVLASPQISPRTKPLAPAVPPDISPDNNRAIKALEDEAATLREALERERESVEHARLAEEQERDRANRAEAERAAALVRAAALEGELAGLREALAEARKPFWRRWLG